MCQFIRANHSVDLSISFICEIMYFILKIRGKLRKARPWVWKNLHKYLTPHVSDQNEERLWKLLFHEIKTSTLNIMGRIRQNEPWKSVVSIIETGKTKFTLTCYDFKKNEASWKPLKMWRKVSNLRFSVNRASVNTLPGHRPCFMTSNRWKVYDYHVAVTLV